MTCTSIQMLEDDDITYNVNGLLTEERLGGKHVSNKQDVVGQVMNLVWRYRQ